MKFDESKVFTALNADELSVGSRVILADCMKDLRNNVMNETHIEIIMNIAGEDDAFRFCDENNTRYALAYLVEEPGTLKWTDLKIGDIIKNKTCGTQYMITGVSKRGKDFHLFYADEWHSDTDLNKYFKVEND